MNLNRRHLVLVLVMASSLFGCKGMWNDLFGGASGSQKGLSIAPGSLEDCPAPGRDPDIASKLANNIACSDDSLCPIGSFCTGNGVSGTCIRECGDLLPNCTGNRYCSCKGVCEDIGQGTGGTGGGSQPVTCERDNTLLAQINGVRPCQWDTDCPNGSSCDRSIARCTWSCNDTDHLCQDTGEQCDCRGNCVSTTPPDGGAPMLRKAFNLVASPTSLDVLPSESGTSWIRAVHVSLQTADASMLVGVRGGGGMMLSNDIDGKVTVRPGASLQIACSVDDVADPTSLDYSTSGCTLEGNWNFTLASDQVAWKSGRVVYVKQASSPPDASAGDAWTIHLASSITTPSVQNVSVNVRPGVDNIQWDLEPTFTAADFRGYSGTVHLFTPLGKGVGVNGGVQPAVDVSVQASLHGCEWVDKGTGTSEAWVCLTISDPSTILTDNETLTLYLHSQESQTRTRNYWDPLPFLEFGCAIGGTGMTGLARTKIDMALEPADPNNPNAPRKTSLRRSVPGDRLTGKFTLGKAWSTGGMPDWLGMEASFQLTPDSAAMCVDDSSCRGGMTCDSSGLCIHQKPASGCSYAGGGGQWGGSVGGQLSHLGAGIGTRILDQIKTSGDGTSHTGLYPAFPNIWTHLYQVSDTSGWGLGQRGSVFRVSPAEVAAFPRLIAPDVLDWELTRPGVAGKLAVALQFFSYDIVDPSYLPDATLTYYLPPLPGNGGWRDVSADQWTQFIISNLAGPSAPEALVPCIDGDAPWVGEGPTPPPSIKDTPHYAVDCGRYWENVKAVAMKSDDFRADCADISARLSVSTDTPYGRSTAWYSVYVCPGMSTVLGTSGAPTSSALVDSANRYLCQNGQSYATTGLQANDVDIGASLLARSGEIPCRDDNASSGGATDYRPSGVDLLTLQDSPNKSDMATDYGTLMRSCISDLQTDLTVPSLSIDPNNVAQSRKDWLNSVFGRRSCFSPAQFWAAYQTTKGAVTNTTGRYYGDQAGQQLMQGLVKQWLQVHAFVLAQGLEEHKLARTQEGNTSLPVGTTGNGSTSVETPTLPAVPLTTIMDLADSGLGLVVAEASGDALMGVAQTALRYPDWRPGLDRGAHASDEQGVGLPVVLVETATKYLRVVEEYMQEAALESFAEVVDGVLPDALVVAQRRAGRALRLTSLIEQIASTMNYAASGDSQPCTNSSQSQVCMGMSCSKQDGSAGVCYGTTWAPRYASATNEYLRAQRDLAVLAQSQMNPLGVDETDLPLFFGDLTGTNSRFFASSDYLLNTWAISAVQTAQAALDKARDAWVQRRNSTLQDEMNATEQDRRIEGVLTKYGEIIAANCGLSARDNPVAILNVLDKAKDFFDPQGARQRCYVDTDLKDSSGNLRCRESPPQPDQSPYEGCVADKTAEASASYLEQMGFYKKDFPDPQVDVEGTTMTVSWACRNYFHLNPSEASNEPTVHVRVSGAALEGMTQGVADFTWYRPDEQKQQEGLVLNGCDVMHPGSYSAISSKTASGDDEKNELSVLRCQKKGDSVVCDRPTPEELASSNPDDNCLCIRPTADQNAQAVLMGTEFDSWWSHCFPYGGCGHVNDYKAWSQMRGNTVIGGITKYFTCKNALFESCGTANAQWQWRNDPSGQPLSTCTNDNTEGTMLLAETSDGVVYRPCGQKECQTAAGSGTPWVYGPDTCGMKIPYGYGDQRWWGGDTAHQGVVHCLKDAYRDETCNRKAYNLAGVAQMKQMPLPADLMKTIDQVCQNGKGVPSDMGLSGKTLTALPLSPDCYLGQLGASVVQGYGALEDVELAKLAWGAAQESYDIQGQQCAGIKKEEEDVTARQNEFASSMANWRLAKFAADAVAEIASAVSNSMTCIGSCSGAQGTVAAARIAGDAMEMKMQNAQQGFDNFMRTETLEEQVRQCFAEANKLQAQFDVEKGQITRRMTGLYGAQQDFTRIMSETERAYVDGIAARDRELGRQANAPRFEFHYWYEEKAERYLREFKWAKRLVYLAMRAVEYEFQQSLGLRKDIVTAQHPDQLEGAIQSLQSEVATRAINRRRPQELSVVLSLRDDVLGIVDASKFQRAGERKATPVSAFRDRLWDAKYAIYDKDGTWAGQGIPFTVTPQGGLLDRCAERLWRVTATIQGDGLSDTQPGATLRVLKKNTFSSQWCEAKGDGSKMQVGSLEASKNLFKDDPGPGVAGETIAYSTAAIYPWFNVRRSDFYKTTYQDGASEELAGRGLYGDYILLFPAQLLEGQEVPNPPPGELKGTRINQFPLDRVEDVMMRFDYLSVDNFAAKGVQPNP